MKGIAAAAVVLMALTSFALLAGRPTSGVHSSTHQVERQLFRVVIDEEGDIESADAVEVPCMVKGGSRILWIVPEGTVVRKGEPIVRLDASLFEDQIRQQEILLRLAEAEQKKAKDRFEVAKLAIPGYLEGTFLQELQTAEANIKVAGEHLQSARNLSQHVERMYRKGYANASKRESTRVDVLRAQAEWNAAELTRKVLVELTKEKMLRELEAAKRAAQADYLAQELTTRLENRKSERLREQIRNCDIRAPRAGMVMYANKFDRKGNFDAPPIEEGAMVRQFQSIVRLPDIERMQVRILVHESLVSRVRPGMRARIRVHGAEAEGSVAAINRQPEPASRYSPPGVKEYATIVRVDRIEEGTSLRPGMSAEVEIETTHIADAITVPSNGLVEEESRFYCFIQTEEGYEKRPVTVRAFGDETVALSDGLREGERVILDPRETIDECREETEQEIARSESAPDTEHDATGPVSAMDHAEPVAATEPAPGSGFSSRPAAHH